MIAGAQDERETAKTDAGMTYEDYVAWLKARKDDTAAFHIERYGQPTVDQTASTVPCAK